MKARKMLRFCITDLGYTTLQDALLEAPVTQCRECRKDNPRRSRCPGPVVYHLEEKQ